EEKICESVDIKATNIVLQGLPQDIYNLVNHNEHAKEIWDRVKLLIQGSELSLQERESKLQHEAHANEVRLARQSILQLSSASQQYYPSLVPQCSYDAPMAQSSQYQPQVVNHSPVVHQQSYQAPALQQSHQAHAIQHPSATETSFGPCFPQTNNQLRTSSNPRNQATIQDRRVTVQTVAGQARAVKCYNCQKEGHFARQCTKPKRPKNSAWFKEKMLLTEALESGAYLDLDQLAFLAYNGDTIIPAQASQEIPTPTAFQAVLMANLSSYDSYAIEEMSSQVAKCNKVQHENTLVNETLTAELERYKEQVKLFEQRQKFDINDREKYIDGQLRQVIIDKNVKVADFEKQIHSLKLQLNATVESHKTLSTIVECLKKESKQKKDKYLNEVIDLQNKNKALDNVVYKMDKKYFEIEKKELSLVNDRLVEHIICQDVMNVVMHVDVHNVLSVNTNCLDNDKLSLESLRMENGK
ncbi:retrovirus-related pol polyprotein from transposon TNT 1-94, partial [Tanacetum coccineum]